MNILNFRKEILSLIFEIKDKNNIEIPYDILIMISFALINIFLCIILSFIPNKLVRKLYSLIFGIIVQYFVYGERVIDTFITDLFIIFLINLIPKKIAKNYFGIIIVLFTFSHMSYLHIERFYLDFAKWSFDHHILYMMTLPKYIMFGYYYQDNLIENIDENSKENNESVNKNDMILCEYSFLNFMSYIHSVPTCIIGPVVSYEKYIRFINLREEFSQISFHYIEIIKKIFFFILITFVYLKTEKLIHANNIRKLYDEIDSIIIDSENNYVEFRKVVTFVIVYTCKIFHKTKYISGFMLSEIMCDFSGQSFESNYYEKLKENKVIRHVDIIKVETNFTSVIFFQYWNISIHHWLKDSFYKRLIKFTNNKNLSNSLTFIISAFWHGFYLSYYVVFGLVIVVQFLQMEIVKCKSYVFNHYGLFSKFLFSLLIYLPHTLCYTCCYAYLGIAMDLLNYKELIDWTVHFKILPLYPVIILGIYFIICKIIHKTQSIKIDKNKNLEDKKLK